MATTFNWSGYTSQGNVMTTELNSLGNTTWSAVGPAYDNTTLLDQHAAVKIDLASLTPTAGAYISVALVRAPDGSNYEDAPSSTNPGYHMVRGTASVTTGVATKRIVIEFDIPPGKWKVALYNACGVALAASGNTVALYTTDDKGN